jgi:SRSO17 transposase
VGVFLAYASPRGRAFLDRELYLPAEWARDAARRQEAHVPEQVRFATKPALARQMLARAFAADVPIAWVTGDEVYGNNPGLRGWLEAGRHPYVLAVSGTHQVWVAGTDGEPGAGEVRALAAALPARAWVRRAAGDGNKGPRLYDWACVRLPQLPTDGMATWVLVRRSLADPTTDLAYFRVYGPVGTALATMVHVAGTRWVIEEVIEHRRPAGAASGGKSGPATCLLIPLTTPEVRRLRCLVLRHRWPRALQFAWSLWRRHQARAMRCHWRKRLRLHPAGWLPHAA